MGREGWGCVRVGGRCDVRMQSTQYTYICIILPCDIVCACEDAGGAHSLCNHNSFRMRVGLVRLSDEQRLCAVRVRRHAHIRQPPPSIRLLVERAESARWHLESLHAAVTEVSEDERVGTVSAHTHPPYKDILALSGCLQVLVRVCSRESQMLWRAHAH